MRHSSEINKNKQKLHRENYYILALDAVHVDVYRNLEELAASFIKIDKIIKDSRFLRNACIYQPDYRMSHHIRHKST